MLRKSQPPIPSCSGTLSSRAVSICFILSGMLVISGCKSEHFSNPQPSTTSSESFSGKTAYSSSGSTGGREMNPAAASTTESSSGANTNPEEHLSPSSPSATCPPGTYLAGSDIPAGTYLIEQDTGMFPGKILLTSDDSGSLASVLDDIGFYNRLYLTIREGEYVQFEGTARPADAAPPYKADNDTYPSGMYLVGKDLKPGVYEISSSRAGTAGSYSISADARGNMSSFYQRTTISEPVMQVLEDGQYITLNGAVMRP